MVDYPFKGCRKTKSSFLPNHSKLQKPIQGMLEVIQVDDNAIHFAIERAAK